MYRIVITAVAGATAAVLLAGCSSSGGGTPSTQSAVAHTSAAPPVSTQVSTAATPTSAGTSSTAASGRPLDGTWKGQYGGAYRGTFTLDWRQSSAKLTGSIQLSNPAATLNIDGTVHGSSISFGTLGSLAVTYSGTVSGATMSGSYQVAGSNAGTWSAAKK